MMKLRFLLVAPALSMALACGDHDAPTAPADSIEDISEAEVLAATHFDELTDEQKAAVRAALQKARAAIARIRASLRAGEISRAEAHRLAGAVHDALIAELEDVLTPEQLDRLTRPGDQRPPDLGLTEEQKAELLELRRDLALFAATLRRRVVNGELSAQEARAELRAAVRRFNAAACAILTAEQRDRFGFCRAAGG